MKIALKYKIEIAGLILGAIAGWCYWYFVGCASRNCLITGRPLNSILYGAITGALSLSLLNNKKEKK